MFLCVLGVSIGSGWAAQTYVPLKQDEIDQTWRWQIFDELKGQGLRAIAQDSTGAMWFGVDAGVLHYDGRVWTSFNESDGVPKGPIHALCTGKDGRVYAASDAGVGCFENGIWTRIFPSRTDFYWPVDDLEVDLQGRIWVATPWGAVRLGAARHRVYTSSEMAVVLQKLVPDVDIAVVPDFLVAEHPRNARQMARHVGLESADVGLAIVKGGWVGLLRGDHPVTIWQVTPHSPADSAGIVPGDLVLSVDQRREVQQLLFAGDAGTVVDLELLRPSTGDTMRVSLVRKQMAGMVRDWNVYDVMVGKDGAIWLGLWNGQVVRFYPDAPQPRWQMWAVPDGLSLKYGPRLFEDHQRRVWRVTNEGGHVYRFQNHVWSPVTDVPLVMGSPMTGVCEDDDGRVFLGGGEIAAYKEGQWKHVNPDFSHQRSGLPNHRNRLLFTNDHAIWLAGLGQGAARLNLDPARGQVYPELKYQADHPLVGTWFVSADSGVVQHMGDQWTRYDVADGGMDWPLSVVVTPKGEVWASGSHQGIASTARFDGVRWHRQTHPRLSRMVAEKGDFVDHLGRVWFGAYHYDEAQGQVGGVLCFDGTQWHHYEPPEALEVVYAMGETQDGRVWAGTHELQYFDGRSWHVDQTLSDVWIHSILGAKDGSLWVGTRLKGIFHHDGKEWHQYARQDGLEGNFFESLTETDDCSIWASGSQGIYQFDGRSWTPNVLPDDLFGHIKHDSQGNMWTVALEWGTTVLQLEKMPPTVTVTSYIKDVTQHGNTLIAWQGQDRWNETTVSDLQYSWRLNDGAWSRYDLLNEHMFLGLRDGAYRFSVRARDKAFNESEVATVSFVVLPPIWKQTWFVGLVSGLVLVIIWQSSRVVRRNRQLQLANVQLGQATDQLQTHVDVLRTLVDTVPIPLFLQDKNQIFTDCNRAFADLFGRVPADILGKKYHQIWPEDMVEKEKETTQVLVEKRLVAPYEMDLKKQDGARRQFVVNKAPLYDPSNGFDGVVAAMFDITERQRSERLARALERDGVVIQTAGAAAHRINQPLTVILGMIELMMTHSVLTDQMKADLMKIHDASRSIESIVKDMQTVREYRTEKYVGDVRIVRFDTPADEEEDSSSDHKME